jgi:hypothetical protein
VFSREKPLPAPVLNPGLPLVEAAPKEGIHLGSGVYWHPESLPNGHIVVIGASGSGKTQTLKAIAYELHQTYPVQIILVDFHGDQALQGERCYPLHMASQWGVNPLVINLDLEGGGPNLQAIAVAATLKKALQMGPNQEGHLLEVLGDVYGDRGITQVNPASWHGNLPNFSHLQEAIEDHVTDGCRECQKLKMKLAATFTYGVFNRPMFPLFSRLIRVDLCKLPPALGAIAAEALAQQLMDQHRLMGEIEGKTPRTYLFIDEAKEMAKSPALDRVIADGRKYGLNLVLASQSERHLSADVIGNSSTKIVLPVDQTEVKKVASKFRFAEAKVAALLPLTALCRFGKQAEQVEILPYYKRVTE